jgi:plastocyanin
MATLRSPLALVATVSVALAALAVLAVGAAAQTIAEVQVRDNVYVGPDGSSTTRVTEGDVVRWRWVGDNEHTVTSLPTAAISFDSDQECPEGDLKECRTKGNVFDVRFDEPGTYHYVCKVHGVLGMAGAIEVAPRQDDSGDDADPSPPGDPTGDQSDDDPPPDDGGGSGETDDGGSSDQTEGSNGSDGQTAPPRRRAAGQSAPRFVPGDEEVEGDPDDGPDPDVAPPGQDFSPFPSPPPGDASEPPDAAAEEMGVAIPGPDGPNRNLLIGIATGLLALTGGSVLKVLLAGPTTWA